MRKPYVILIGSSSGVGKSTIAIELSRLLNITHLIETDIIREAIRSIISKEYAPELHLSSYNAYESIKYDIENKKLIIDGFEKHSSFVIPALEKIISKSIEENKDIIIEGVHLIPGMLNLDRFMENSEIYFFILTNDETSHKERLKLKNINYFKENRIIHDYLIKKAKINKVAIINNNSIELAITKMKNIINNNSVTLKLKYGIDKIPEILNIIVKNNNAMIETIEYDLNGFNEPLIRNINISDETSVNTYLTTLAINKNVKDYLQNIINQTKYYKMKITASNNKDLNNIINELDKKNYIYK